LKQRWGTGAASTFLRPGNTARETIMTNNRSIAGDDVVSDTPGTEAARNESLRIPLAEEVLEAEVVEREQGRLRIHKSVETVPVQTSVDLHHDQYVVERVEIDETVAERRDPWYEGGALLVPVYEEVLVTETKLRLKEIIRLENTGEVEQVNLRGTLRRDVVEIDDGSG
jgi:stress response protein YsnF